MTRKKESDSLLKRRKINFFSFLHNYIKKICQLLIEINRATARTKEIVSNNY